MVIHHHVMLDDAKPLRFSCRALERRPFERISPAAVHAEFFVIPKNKPYRAVRPNVRHAQNTGQFEYNCATRSIVVGGLTAAAAVHVR